MKNQILFFLMSLLTILLSYPTLQYFRSLTEYNKLLTCNNGICFILSLIVGMDVIARLVLPGTFLLCLCLAIVFLKKTLKQRKTIPPITSKSVQPLLSSKTPTTILEAILNTNPALVRTALQDHPEQLNTAYAQNGNTPLHVAALNGYTEIVRLLLEQPGIDTARTNNEGKTALDLAREKGHTEVAQLLEKNP